VAPPADARSMTGWKSHLPTIEGPARSATVAEAVGGYLAELEARGAPSAREVASFLRCWLTGPDSLGAVPVVALTARELEAWCAWRRSLDHAAAEKTIRKHLALLRAALRPAVEAGVIPANPAGAMRARFRPSNRTRPSFAPAAQVASVGEALRLLYSASIAPERRAFYAAAYLTGARVAELRALDFGSLRERSDGLAELRIVEQEREHGARRAPKGKVARVVPVHPRLGAFLLGRRAAWVVRFGRSPEPTDPLLWRSGPWGAALRWAPQTARRWFLADLAALGLAPRTLHSTRHTFVSWCLRFGGAERFARLLTHAPVRGGDAFAAYAHADWSALCRVVEAIPIGDADIRRAQVAGVQLELFGGEP
jgi:integrase